MRLEGDEHHLSPYERETINLEVDRFVRILANRYGVEPHEVVDAVRWVQAEKSKREKYGASAITYFISMLIAGISVAAWEGLKRLIKNG